MEYPIVKGSRRVARWDPGLIDLKQHFRSDVSACLWMPCDGPPQVPWILSSYFPMREPSRSDARSPQRFRMGKDYVCVCA